MKYFDFNPFMADAIKIDFDCIRCGTHVISDEIHIPPPNYAAESSADSQVSDNDYVECDNCSLEYEIDIYVSYSGGDGSISELPDEYPINVEEIGAEYHEEEWQEQEKNEYNLNALEVLKVLKEKGADYLHHANTVTTSHSFLSVGKLLSRDATVRSGLRQTSQKSDDKDKRYGIWNYLFLDTVDIHERTRNFNFYGPVLFVFNVDFLSKAHVGSIRVTKKNPSKWKDDDMDSDRYYISIEELNKDLQLGSFDSMLMIEGTNGEIPFDDSLERILLDDPNCTWSGDSNVYEVASNYLESGKNTSGIAIPINKRGHFLSCKCVEQYKAMYDKSFTKLFLPNSKA